MYICTSHKHRSTSPIWLWSPSSSATASDTTLWCHPTMIVSHICHHALTHITLYYQLWDLVLSQVHHPMVWWGLRRWQVWQVGQQRLQLVLELQHCILAGGGSVIMIYGLAANRIGCDSSTMFNLHCSYGNVLKVCCVCIK